jgi:quinolinate synthase
MNKTVEKINKLKKERNAVILAHCYQPVEVDLVADYVGDSLYLSQIAAKTDAEIIVFAGVYFMAQSAKILSPNKKVLLPNKNAGCKMADMIDLDKLREFKKQHPNIPVVCYINSTAEVKSECDICCTSSNAIDIVKSLNTKEVIFVPDKNLGNYVQSQLPDIKIHTYNGFCPVHNQITVEDINLMKKMYPNAKIFTHPECKTEVIELSDFVGSTSQIIKKVENSSDNEFIIVTEFGVVERLGRDYPEKSFYLVSNKAVCKDMKLHKLEDILSALQNEEYEININDDLRERAYLPIKRMLNLRKK